MNKDSVQNMFFGILNTQLFKTLTIKKELDDFKRLKPDLEIVKEVAPKLLDEFKKFDKWTYEKKVNENMNEEVIKASIETMKEILRLKQLCMELLETLQLTILWFKDYHQKQDIQFPISNHLIH